MHHQAANVCHEQLWTPYYLCKGGLASSLSTATGINFLAQRLSYPRASDLGGPKG